MDRYLVTGGAGFIGSHLVDALLARGHAVRVLDDLSTGRLSNLPDGVEFIEGDILDASLVHDCLADVDGCFHLAAISSVHGTPEMLRRAHRVNLDGGTTLFDAVAGRAVGGAAIPVVFASSAAVYGDAQEIPISGVAATRPISAYGADKAAVEKYAKDVWDRSGVASIGLRLFNVYGPRQDPTSPYSGVISIFLDKLLAGEPVEIFGDGEQLRDFVYVGDAVAYLLAAMAATPAGAEIFNGCTGRGTTINRLYSLLQELTGTDLPAAFRPARAGDIRASVGDPNAAEQAFSICADTELRDGLEQTLQHRIASDDAATNVIASASD
jgi:UDP-glucose 4-epimerase